MREETSSIRSAATCAFDTSLDNCVMPNTEEDVGVPP